MEIASHEAAQVITHTEQEVGNDRSKVHVGPLIVNGDCGDNERSDGRVQREGDQEAVANWEAEHPDLEEMRGHGGNKTN